MIPIILAEYFGAKCSDCVLCLGAALGLDKAPSGGEMPYLFNDPASEPTNSSSRSSSKRLHLPSLPPIDDEGVFDPMTDFDAPTSVSGATLDQGGSQVRSDLLTE